VQFAGNRFRACGIQANRQLTCIEAKSGEVSSIDPIPDVVELVAGADRPSKPSTPKPDNGAPRSAINGAGPTTVVFVGPNGVGKTLLAQNLAYRAIVRGHAVRFTSASDMLNDLSGRDGSALKLRLKLRLKQYVSPKLLVIDELGYLGYDNRGVDLLYQVISRRYESRAAIVLTTNKPFAEWNSVFDSAACLTGCAIGARSCRSRATRIA
jgi:hypothetical protein